MPLHLISSCQLVPVPADSKKRSTRFDLVIRSANAASTGEVGRIFHLEAESSDLAAQWVQTCQQLLRHAAVASVNESGNGTSAADDSRENSALNNSGSDKYWKNDSMMSGIRSSLKQQKQHQAQQRTKSQQNLNATMRQDSLSQSTIVSQLQQPQHQYNPHSPLSAHNRTMSTSQLSTVSEQSQNESAINRRQSQRSGSGDWTTANARGSLIGAMRNSFNTGIQPVFALQLLGSLQLAPGIKQYVTVHSSSAATAAAAVAASASQQYVSALQFDALESQVSFAQLQRFTAMHSPYVQRCLHWGEANGFGPQQRTLFSLHSPALRPHADTLFALLLQYTRLTDKLTLSFAAQLICALQQIHNKGFQMMNLSPETVCLDSNGRVVLQAHSLLFQTSNINTLPIEYLTPESVATLKPTDRVATDVWRLGCLLYELSVGVPALRIDKRTITTADAQKQAVTNKLLAFDPATSVQFPPTVSAPLQALIRLLLTVDPTQRCAAFRSVQQHAALRHIDWRAKQAGQIVQDQWLIENFARLAAEDRLSSDDLSASHELYQSVDSRMSEYLHSATPVNLNSAAIDSLFLSGPPISTSNDEPTDSASQPLKAQGSVFQLFQANRNQFQQ